MAIAERKGAEGRSGYAARHRQGWSLDWLFLGIGPARSPGGAGSEMAKARQIGNLAAIAIAVGAMAKALKIDLSEMSSVWANQLLSGEPPKIDGIKLLGKLSDIIKEISQCPE